MQLAKRKTALLSLALVAITSTASASRTDVDGEPLRAAHVEHVKSEAPRFALALERSVSIDLDLPELASESLQPRLDLAPWDSKPHVRAFDLELEKQPQRPQRFELGIASGAWETGLYYAKARYLDPEFGRFLSEDPFGGAADTPPSLHRYLYAYGNPARFTDPTGMAVGDWWDAQSYVDFHPFSAESIARSAKFAGQEVLAGAEFVNSIPQQIMNLPQTTNQVLGSLAKASQSVQGCANNPSACADVGGEFVAEAPGRAAQAVENFVNTPSEEHAQAWGPALASAAIATAPAASISSRAASGLTSTATRIESEAITESATAAKTETVVAEGNVTKSVPATTSSASGSPSFAPFCGSGGPCTVYEIPGEELTSGVDYIGKTKRTVPQRMADPDHRLKTLTGKPPTARALAENLTPEEAAGVEALLVQQRGLENLSNKIPPLNPDLPKNAAKIEAGKRVLEKPRGPG